MLSNDLSLAKFKDVEAYAASVIPKGEIAWSQFYVTYKRISEAANITPLLCFMKIGQLAKDAIRNKHS